MNPRNNYKLEPWNRHVYKTNTNIRASTRLLYFVIFYSIVKGVLNSNFRTFSFELKKFRFF